MSLTSDRVARLQTLMHEEGVESVVLSAGSDLVYFSGYAAMPLERITAFVIPQSGEPTLFVPQLEAPRVRDRDYAVVPWGETEDPLRSIADNLSDSATISVNETMWSAFLLEFQALLPNVGWQVATELTRELRMRKHPQEIAALRSAAEATDRVLARVPGEVRFEGRTESEIAADFARMTVEEGHDSAWFTIIASGPNSASPHHETGSRIVEAGEIVVCDFGGTVSGYHSDVTRTFVVGEPTGKQQEVHQVVVAANEAGRGRVAPGLTCEEIDRAAREVIEAAGYGEFFIHRTGHGIGLDGHEHPYIVEGSSIELEENMTFSVEPGIYIPGEFGVRIEDIVACGPGNVVDLNRASRTLVSVT